MSKVAVLGNVAGTGVFTVASPNSNTDRTLTLPDESGTVLTTTTPGVPVNGPAFSAYNSASQTISSTIFTKIAIDTEEFDTANAYDAANYRFTPQVAGYYQINGAMNFSTSTSATRTLVTIRKNNVEAKRGNDTSATNFSVTVSALIYLNGTTDYVELFAYIAATTAVVTKDLALGTYFQAFLARSA